LFNAFNVTSEISISIPHIAFFLKVNMYYGIWRVDVSLTINISRFLLHIYPQLYQQAIKDVHHF